MAASRAQRASVAARRAQAIALKLAGVDYQRIADQLGYASRGAAHTDITRALEANLAQLRSTTEVLRELELARLDRLQATYWGLAVQGDAEAAKLILKIVDKRCVLLALNRPTQVEVITISAIEAEIARLEEELKHTGQGVADGGDDIVGRDQTRPTL